MFNWDGAHKVTAVGAQLGFCSYAWQLFIHDISHLRKNVVLSSQICPEKPWQFEDFFWKYAFYSITCVPHLRCRLLSGFLTVQKTTRIPIGQSKKERVAVIAKLEGKRLPVYPEPSKMS
jgi:hypothetical protein